MHIGVRLPRSQALLVLKATESWMGPENKSRYEAGIFHKGK